MENLDSRGYCLYILIASVPKLRRRQELLVSPAYFLSPNHLSLAQDCPAIYFLSYCLH